MLFLREWHKHLPSALGDLDMVDLNKLKDEFIKGTAFQPFISSIVFPNYKNISKGEKIDFDFPLTLLIGRNGTNKSSILHALYGAPHGKSTEDYWFSTYVDEINSENQQSFFYQYQIPDTKQIAEVRKIMTKKEGIPEYWEPARPSIRAGMQKFDLEKIDNKFADWVEGTRWKVMRKPVIYLDFRAEISAFDKAFYKDRYSSNSRADHRHRLRKRSRPLKKAIDKNLNSHVYFTKQRIFCNVEFDEDQRNYVNEIIGAKYTKIVYIEHDYYLSDSFSVYLGTGNENQYSEAFAGSGETSVVRLVYALDNAEENSLVLLDEPETSLHIDAQYRLQKFILEKVKEKKLQVVMSTHSPFFAKELPDEAIKVLTKNEISKKVEIINSAPAEEATFFLGHRRSFDGKIIVFVEDKLAKAICEHVVSEILSESEADILEIQHYPGGNQQLLKLAISESTKPTSNCVFLFDGDCKPAAEIPDPTTIAEDKNENLKTLLTELFRFDDWQFPQDSNQPQQKFTNYRNFLKFAAERFRYLPFENPEEFLVKTSSMFTDSSKKPKNIIENKARKLLSSSGKITSENILTVQRLALSNIPCTDQSLIVTAEILKKFKKFAPSM